MREQILIDVQSDLVAAGATRCPSRPSLPDSIGTAYCRISYLEEILVPRVAGWIPRPSFQKLALGPLETLLPGSSSKRRELVDRLKLELNDSAQVLMEFAHRNASRLEPVLQKATRQRHRATYLFPSAGISVAALRRNIADLQARLEGEWAWAEDYFGPSHDVSADAGDGTLLQRAEFVRCLNHELQYAGNYVARCMLTRAKTSMGQLEDSLSDLEAGLAAANVKDRPGAEIVARPKRLLAELRQLVLHQNDAVLEESAIVLLQTYLEFWPGECDLSWLPTRANEWRSHSGMLRWALKSGKGDESGALIERSLKLIQKWFAGQDLSQSALEEAVTGGGLVLQMSGRRAYWEGKLIDVDWTRHARPWELLAALALSRGRTLVNAVTVYGKTNESNGFGALRTLKCELMRMLPRSLAERVEPIRGRQCYRLNLPSNRVSILDS